MIKNFDVNLKDKDQNNWIENEKPVSAKALIIDAILANLPDEQPNALEKMQRYDLYKKLLNGGDVELTTEELSLIKQAVGKIYSPLAVGQIYEIIEG